MIEITYQNYKELISKNKSTIGLLFYNGSDAAEIDYIENVLQQSDYADRCFKTDLQKDGAVFASLFGVVSSPTLLLLNQGKEDTRYSGYLEKSQISDVFSNL